MLSLLVALFAGAQLPQEPPPEAPAFHLRQAPNAPPAPEPTPAPSAELSSPESAPAPSAELSSPEPTPAPSAELSSPESAPAPSAERSSPESAPAPSTELSAPELAAEAEALAPLEPVWLLLQTLLVLAGVVLLAYILLSWGGKRMLKWRDGGAGRAIAILERVSVDAKKSLLLVKVANDYFLLSNGEREVTVLSKLDAGEIEQALSDRKPPEPGLFLKKLLARKTTQAPPNEGAL